MKFDVTLAREHAADHRTDKRVIVDQQDDDGPMSVAEGCVSRAARIGHACRPPERAAGLGASQRSRPTRYSSVIRIKNGKHDSRSEADPLANGFPADIASSLSLKSCMKGAPAMKAIRMPAMAPPAMYPEAISTPGLLSPSATSCSSVSSWPRCFRRMYRSTSQRISPPKKIGDDDDSGR